MTAHPAGGREPDDHEPRDDDSPRDAGHLDRDPEALEDPVHRGDAEHQAQNHRHDGPAGTAERSG